jgi:hypothetical protein
MSSNLCKGEGNCTTKGSKVISVNDEGNAHVPSYFKDSISVEKPFENSYTSLKKPENSFFIKKIKPQKESQRENKEENITIKMTKRKKKVKYKDPFIDLVDIESYKYYNEIMTYSEYTYSTEKIDIPKKKLCESIWVCAKKVCIIF